MGRFGVNWLLDNFVSIESKPSSRIPTIQVRQRQPKLSQTQDFITENELDGHRFIHPYMYKRRLTDEIIEKFDVGYDSCFRLKDKDGNLLPSIECITFPVWDSKGNCVFVARRAIHTKFFHYPTDADKPVYGLNFIPRRIRSVVVCESIFNALTCWAYGYPAIALIGTGSYEQIEILNKSHISRFVLALDPDEAGYKGKLRLRNKLSKTKLISELEIPQGKDVNDLSKEEFDSLPEYRVNHLDNVQYKKMIDALKK
jgi:DNA primase